MFRSDINLTYSSIAREYLISEGIDPDTVIKTGSPMYEVINYYKEKIDKTKIVTELGLKQHEYFIVSCHREENITNNVMFENFSNILNSLAEKYKFPIVVSTHPRTRQRVEENKDKFNDLIQFVKPLGFSDYVNLQINEKAVRSDSKNKTEESPTPTPPAINIREAHERPEGMEEASVMFTGMSSERVHQALEILETQPRDDNRLLLPVNDYLAPSVSEKVARIILSYTDYINRTVWKKY